MKTILVLSMVLGVGFSDKIPIHPGEHVLLENGALAKVKDLGSQLLVTGKKTGTTRLTIGERRFDVVISDRAGYLAYQELKKNFDGIEGLELRASESTPVVDGELLSLEDWKDLALISLEHGLKYRFQARIFEPLAPAARQHLIRLSTERQLAPPAVVVKETVSLKIPAGSAALRQQYETLYRPYGLEVLEDPGSVAIEPLIEVEILVAEIRQSGFKRLGIEWPTTYSTQTLPGPVSLLVHALEEQGIGRVLASPKLLCRSGKEASFLAGGEFPIKIVNFRVNDVIWKKHGILLNIKPVADRAGRMSIEVETEVSMIDPAHTVDGVPGMLTNRIRSHFDLESSRTISLSGLIKQESSEARSGLVGLSGLPILGALFSSRDYRENRTELVFLVTPKVLP